MTKLKDQPWYDKNFKKYPNRLFTYKGVKFIPGKVYVATSHWGNKEYWYCESRSDNGFIFFRKYHPGTKTFDNERVRRKPEKGWEGSDERLEIVKSHTTSIRGYHSGGSMLYARYVYKNKKTHKIPAPFGL